MLPYSLILLAIVLSYLFGSIGIKRKIAFVIFSMILVYSITFSFTQIGKIESEEPGSLYELNRIINSNDVVIMSQKEFDNRIPTPLRLYFNKQVFFFFCKQ